MLQLIVASTLPESIDILSLEITWPRKKTLSNQNSHFLSLANS